MNRTDPISGIADALRRERARAGLSLTELARQAGIAKSTLSQLESGSGNPSVETLWALAVALGVPFSRVVEPEQQPVRVIRAGGGLSLPSDQAAFTGTVLSTCPPGARRDIHLVTMEPGADRQADAHIPGTMEHNVVIAGRLRCGPVGEEIELSIGDYACYRADLPHTYRALEPNTAAVMVMEYR